MSLNKMVATPTYGTFTLEDLGLGQTNPNPDPNLDHVNDNDVLGYQKPDAPDAVIVSDGATPGPHNTSLSEKEIEAIPSWDSRIRILKEHADKIVDMREVQQDIEGSGVIDRRHSDVIEATFENFYTPRNQAVMYTTFESLTNFGTAKTFMQKKINTSMEAFVTEYEAVNTNIASEMAKDLLAAKDFCIYDLHDTLNEAVSHIQEVVPRLYGSPIILPFQDGQFLDITCQDFTQIDISTVDVSVPFSDEFMRSYAKMVALWKSNTKLRDFVNDSMVIHKQNNPESITPNVHDGLYLATILTSFGAWASDIMYQKYVEHADTQANSITSLHDQIKASVQKGGLTPDVAVSANGGELSRLANEAASLKGSAAELGEFAKAAATVVVGFASLR